MKFKGLLFFLIVIIRPPVMAIQPAAAMQDRDGDYTSYPVMEIAYTELEAHLEIGFENHLIKGEVTYQFNPRHDDVDQMVWSAPGIDIRQITINGAETTFEHEHDSLVISFDEMPGTRQSSSINVTYQAEPVFGVHFANDSTIFSSNLPGGVAHWLPGPVHPRNSMPVQLSIEVPEGFTAVSGGELNRQEDTERGHRYIWVSDRAVPLSELAFAVGEFDYTQAYAGTKNLRIYHQKGALKPEDRQQLLEHIVQRVHELEYQLRRELPVSSFQAVVLPDDKWETRSYAAGLTCLFESKGSLEIQATRALAAQWFGIALRPEQWKDSDFITLMQAILADQIEEPDYEQIENPLRQFFDVPETVYQTAGMNYRQWARNYIRHHSSSLLVSSLTASVRDFAGMEGVRTSRDFSRFLYERTGRWMETPPIRDAPADPVYRYRARIEEIRGSDNFSIEITPLAELTDEEFHISIHWDRDQRIFQQDYSIDGRGETIELEPEGNVNNLWIDSSEDSIKEFEVEKPFSFWLYQLRRDENPERRKEAAEALREFASDPDLQLAVQDMMSNEDHPEVLTKMYRLMGEITAGASGTERRFLDGIENRNPGIRMVSMKALSAYGDNDRVEEAVLTVIQTSDDLELVNEAIHTYRQLIDDEAFRDFTLRFLQEDREDLLFTETLLQELFEVAVTDEAIAMTTAYLDEEFPFDLRWLSYRLLRNHAGDDNWQQTFLEQFYDDPDPRIRFLTLFSLSELEAEERKPFLQERMSNEYDIRILEQVRIFSTDD